MVRLGAALLVGVFGCVTMLASAEVTSSSATISLPINEIHGPKPIKSFAPQSSKSPIAPTLTPKISQADAANIVRKEVDGQVMGVNLQKTDNSLIYAVKILDDGRMRTLHVDGITGQLMSR